MWLFTEQFINEENGLLERDGVQEPARRQILYSATFFKDALQRPADFQTVISALKKFQDDVCGRSAESLNAEQRFRFVRRALGIVAIVGDALAAGAVAPTGVGAVLVGASVTIGTGMVLGQQD